ncbi:MAG: hypothetical protein KDD64_17400, partial [Bdellovibrionales bacterium]|nr:hypothetical protein [Bdellovibrionales bacterium]
ESEIVRAVAHFLFENPSPASLAYLFAWLEGGKGEPEVRAQVVSKALALSKTDMSTALHVLLPQLPGAVGDGLRWFSTGPTSESWRSVALEKLLELLLHPESVSWLQFEQAADLLRFPQAPVREKGIQRLKVELHDTRSTQELIDVLSTPSTQVKREQVVLLLLALESKGEAQYSFLAKWFETDPDPSLVFALLLSRRSIEGLDPFSVEAARYLIDKHLAPTVEQLEALASHPEALARALGYQYLDASVPAHRRILEAMIQVEPSSRVRDRLRQKLELADERLKGQGRK